MVGKNSGYIQTLPKEVKRRIKALKKIQIDIFGIETKFYDDIHALECKYSEMYRPLFDKRSNIVNAVYEPTEEECDWKSDEEVAADDEVADAPKLKPIMDSNKNEQESPTDLKTSGIPEFWLTIFKNVEMIAVRIQDHDEPILKHLFDVRVKYSPPEHMGFTLEFVFSANDYFTNEVLTKEYMMRSPPDPECPLTYEGPEIIKCIGCKIDWKAGKNVTVKNVKKKMKGKSGPKKVVIKTVKEESFFNFFSTEDSDKPIAHADEDEETDAEHELMMDYEIGQLLQTSIIPRAVLYFTGEALEEDEEEEDGDEDEDDDDEDDKEENSEDDKDYTPNNGKAKKKKVPTATLR